MKKDTKKVIVFITGAFLSNDCWEDWITYFENRGYIAYAPAWPHKNHSSAVLRSWLDDSAIAGLGLNDIYLHFENFIKKLGDKPIVIGHSFGGLIAQLLLEKDLVQAAIAIHPIPPQGVRFSMFSLMSLLWNPLGYFTPIGSSYLISLREWRYAFTNGLTFEKQKESYEKYVVPESRLAINEALSTKAKINFKIAHEPLFILAGSEDRLLPASLAYANYKKYQNKNSIVDFRELEGRNHFSLKQDTWRIDADCIMDWIDYATY